MGVSAGRPLAAGLGTDLDDNDFGILLSFGFEQSYFRYGAVHEFGHALAYDHEQARSDTPSTCSSEDSSGDTLIGAWDLYSIMNYCNPYDTAEGKLSATDIDAVSRFYGAPVPVAAVSTGTGNVDIFARRNPDGPPTVDGRLFTRQLTSSGWGTWLDLGTPDVQPLTSAPSAVSWGPGRLDVFVRSSAGHLIQTARNGGTWSAWADHGGILSGAPVAVSRAPNQLTVVAKNTSMPNAGISIREWNGTSWLPWVTISGDIIGSPSVVVTQDGAVHVFAKWDDDSLRVYRSGSTGSWTGVWTNLGGAMQGSPAAVVLKNTSNVRDLYVFVVGLNDNNLYFRHYGRGESGSGWDTLWTPLSGPPSGIKGAPTALSRTNEILDIFVHDGEGQLWSVARTASPGWSSWSQLTSSSAAWGIGSPTAVSTGSEIHVFSRTDPAAELRDMRWSPTLGWWQDSYSNWSGQPVF